MSVACVLQTLRIAGALAAAGLCGTASLSSAAVVPIFSTESDTITAGEKGVLNLHLDLNPDSSKYHDAQFAGGKLTIYSDTGSFTSFDLGVGGTVRDFTYAFDYAAPGSYTPSFVLTGSFTQKYDETISYGVTSTKLVKTGLCAWCVIAKTVIVQKSELKTFSDSKTFALDGDLSVTVEAVITPLPAALPLYATGLGLIALLAWRKRRRGASAA